MSTSKSKDRSKKKNIINEAIEDVTKMVKTSVFAGLGLAFLGQEKIEKFVKDIAKDNKLSTTDVKSFIRDVRKQSTDARKDVEKRVKSLIDDIIPSTEKKSAGGSKKKSKNKKKISISSKKKSYSDSSEGLLVKAKEEYEKPATKDTEAREVESYREGNNEEKV